FIWTEPYIFFTAQKLGITAAKPVKNRQGQQIGVVGIDLELDALAGFLAARDISATGSAFIASGDGVLLATPTMQGMKTDNLESLSIKAMKDPVGRQLLEMIRTASRTSNMRNSATFRVGSSRYVSDSMPMNLADGKQWLIGTYADRGDLLTVIRKSDRRNIYLAIAIMLIALLIGALLATSAWTPVELLHFQANRDQLTHLHNRHYLNKYGPHLFADAAANQETISTVIVDLDHFKAINDTFGHAAGDAVIKTVAKRLQNAARSHDIVARFGGEEFVMLLPTACAETAKDVLERAKADLKENPIAFADREIPVSFSAGICEINDDLTQLEPVLNEADKA
ncbi:MAG: GGDEF domain-containing protein, partial [Gammaproteobacteria bacterium]|nr:GGDEF domain-containing protein [Gammaproteobacteria bacterium]